MHTYIFLDYLKEGKMSYLHLKLLLNLLEDLPNKQALTSAPNPLHPSGYISTYDFWLRWKEALKLDDISLPYRDRENR